MPTTSYIGVGSNLGDRQRTLDEAKDVLRNSVGVWLKRCAPVYDTEPVGGPVQGNYLNTVWEIESEIGAHELLRLLMKIETRFDRQRQNKNEPRTLDLDLLFHGDEVIHDPALTVPHPRLQDRWFVLKPLWDLRSDLVHPVSGKSVCEMLDQVNGSLKKS
jgi:2-amino-4-hydroxy-6-hydroxymethyldihydropteridine diphosphokinase